MFKSFTGGNAKPVVTWKNSHRKIFLPVTMCFMKYIQVKTSLNWNMNTCNIYDALISKVSIRKTPTLKTFKFFVAEVCVRYHIRIVQSCFKGSFCLLHLFETCFTIFTYILITCSCKSIAHLCTSNYFRFTVRGSSKFLKYCIKWSFSRSPSPMTNATTNGLKLANIARLCRKFEKFCSPFHLFVVSFRCMCFFRLSR